MSVTEKIYVGHAKIVHTVDKDNIIRIRFTPEDMEMLNYEYVRKNMEGDVIIDLEPCFGGINKEGRNYYSRINTVVV